MGLYFILLSAIIVPLLLLFVFMISPIVHFFSLEKLFIPHINLFLVYNVKNDDVFAEFFIFCKLILENRCLDSPTRS